MPRAIKFHQAGLFAGAIGLYVTVWLFMTDICMLSLKMSRPDFNTPLFHFLLHRENILYHSTFALRLCFMWLTLPFLNSSQIRHLFRLSYKFTLCFTKTSFENITHRLLWFLIKNNDCQPDFKHSISSLWKYRSPFYGYFETGPFSTYDSVLNPSHTPCSS